MIDLEIKAEELKHKISKLIKQYSEINDEISKLKTENEALNKIISTQKNTIKSLEEQNKIIKLAESLKNSKSDTHELKKKVNEYLHEIDECIRLLSDR